MISTFAIFERHRLTGSARRSAKGIAKFLIPHVYTEPHDAPVRTSLTRAYMQVMYAAQYPALLPITLMVRQTLYG